MKQMVTRNKLLVPDPAMFYSSFVCLSIVTTTHNMLYNIKHVKSDLTTCFFWEGIDNVNCEIVQFAKTHIHIQDK